VKRPRGGFTIDKGLGGIRPGGEITALNVNDRLKPVEASRRAFCFSLLPSDGCATNRYKPVTLRLQSSSPIGVPEIDGHEKYLHLLM
jgi:hypothetical protein